MSDHAMTAASDAGSLDSFDLAPDSPITREKTQAAHQKWILELEQSPEYKMLETYTQTPETTTEAAIHQLIDLTHQSAHQETTGNHCWITACSILELASRTAPDQQARLATFLISLRAVTLIDASTNEPWTFEDGEGTIWHDLPTFGYTIADEMGSFDGHDHDYTREESRRWENLTAFLAQIDASTSESASVLDFSSSWALTAFAWAFEGGSERGSASELALRLACIWLVYDAEKLWAKVCDAGVESNTLERWNGWGRGLVDGQSRFVGGTTSALVASALAQMQRVQGRA